MLTELPRMATRNATTKDHAVRVATWSGRNACQFRRFWQHWTRQRDKACVQEGREILPMPGLIRGVARTAVIAGTATAVSNRVSRRQAQRWAEQDQAQQQQAPPEYQQAPPQYQQPPPPPVPVGTIMVVQSSTPPAEDDMSSKLAQLQQLGELRAQGILTDAEFDEQKQRILGS